jgi:prepilin-type N-terminal cleavage/methylation domain-containing protein
MRRGAGAHPGLTLLEVVVALAMVAGMATIVLSTVSLIENAAARERHRVNGVEVAHRTILQLIDNHKFLDGQPQRVEQDGQFYQFDYRVDVLTREDGLGGEKSTRRRATAAADSNVEDRLRAQIHQITVIVYLEDDRGARALEPCARLTRIYNPVLGEGERGIQYVMDLFTKQFGGL